MCRQAGNLVARAARLVTLLESLWRVVADADVKTKADLAPEDIHKVALAGNAGHGVEKALVAGAGFEPATFGL